MSFSAASPLLATSTRNSWTLPTSTILRFWTVTLNCSGIPTTKVGGFNGGTFKSDGGVTDDGAVGSAGVTLFPGGAGVTLFPVDGWYFSAVGTAGELLPESEGSFSPPDEGVNGGIVPEPSGTGKILLSGGGVVTGPVGPVGLVGAVAGGALGEIGPVRLSP